MRNTDSHMNVSEMKATRVLTSYFALYVHLNVGASGWLLGHETMFFTVFTINQTIFSVPVAVGAKLYFTTTIDLDTF